MLGIAALVVGDPSTGDPVQGGPGGLDVAIRVIDDQLAVHQGDGHPRIPGLRLAPGGRAVHKADCPQWPDHRGLACGGSVFAPHLG